MNKLARFIPTIKLSQYNVVNKAGQDMGQVQTFVVDMHEGLIAFVLVSFGGTLGFGDKWFALPWDALKWYPETMKFVLDMPEEVLKNAPGMDKGKWLQEIENWQKEEDLAHIDSYYTTHGYKSYLGIVREVAINRGRTRKAEARFEINRDISGDYRFRLVAPNGQTISVSDGYSTKDGAMNGIASVRENAAVAVVDDMSPVPVSIN